MMGEVKDCAPTFAAPYSDGFGICAWASEAHSAAAIKPRVRSKLDRMTNTKCSTISLMNEKGRPGKIPSPETRAKLSAALSGRTFSDSHRENLSRVIRARPSWGVSGLRGAYK